MKKVKAVKHWAVRDLAGDYTICTDECAAKERVEYGMGLEKVRVWVHPVSGYARPQPLPKPRDRGKVEYWVPVYAKSPKWYWKADHATGSVTCHDKGKPDGFAVAATPSECGGPDDKQITLSQVRTIRKSWTAPATLPKNWGKMRKVVKRG